jgi:glutathione-specific gamma-glutamylcyclotransferase
MSPATDDRACPPPPDGKDLWIFAYGSLIWDPGFPFEEARPALLRGYHRAFCLYSLRYRGTPERPGLVLGLDRGGACRGIAYRVAAPLVEQVWSYLWEREMSMRSYHCRLLSIAVAGRNVEARTFVVDRTHPNYAGKLDPLRTAEIICDAHGQRGACFSYLENTVRHLDQLGIPDRRLHELLTRCMRAAAPRRRSSLILFVRAGARYQSWTTREPPAR